MIIPTMTEYKNYFEKQIFFAVNVARANPSAMVPHVRSASKLSMVEKVPSSTVKNLIDFLKQAEDRRPIYLDDKLSEACIKNNDAKIALDQEVPDRFGNIDAYKQIVGVNENENAESKFANLSEYTMCKWESSNAQELIGLELIQDWNREGEGKHFCSPILEVSTNKMGLSNKPHKKTVNLIQIIY